MKKAHEVIAASNEEIILTVTSFNQNVFTLDQRMGFEVTTRMTYFIYHVDG